MTIALLLVCRDRDLTLTVRTLRSVSDEKGLELLLSGSREEAPDLHA